MKKRITHWNGYQLRPHQQDILPKLLSHEYYGIFFGMQLGKTWPSLIAAEIKGKPTLVVCPPNCIHVWEKATDELDIKIPIKIISSGSLRNKEKTLAIIKEGYKILIVDELQQYRAWSSQTQNLYRIRKTVENCYGLSGTPFDKNYDEFFYPLLILDKGDLCGRNRGSFRDNVCTMEMRGNRPVYKMREEYEKPFREKIREFSMSHLSDKMNFPEVEEIFYELTEEQEFFMENLDVRNKKKEPIPQINGHNILLESGTHANKQMQVTSGFYIMDDKIHRGISTNKFEVLKNLFEEKIKGQKTIIWVRYKEEYKEVLKCLNGIRSGTYSTKNLEKFWKDELDVLVCHPRSAGCGVNISVAQNAVYITESNSNVDAMQASARLNVYEGEKKKTVYYLVANTSVVKNNRTLMREKEKKTKQFFK